MYYQRVGQDAHLQRLQKDGSVVVDEAGVALRVARDGAQLLLLQRSMAYKTGEHLDSSVFLIVCALQVVTRLYTFSGRITASSIAIRFSYVEGSSTSRIPVVGLVNRAYRYFVSSMVRQVPWKLDVTTVEFSRHDRKRCRIVISGH